MTGRKKVARPARFTLGRMLAEGRENNPPPPAGPSAMHRDRTILAWLRIRAGMVQAELAGKLGVSVRTIRYWEARGLPLSGATRKGVESVFEGLVELTAEERKEIHNERRDQYI